MCILYTCVYHIHLVYVLNAYLYISMCLSTQKYTVYMCNLSVTTNIYLYRF